MERSQPAALGAGGSGSGGDPLTCAAQTGGAPSKPSEEPVNWSEISNKRPKKRRRLAALRPSRLAFAKKAASGNGAASLDTVASAQDLSPIGETDRRHLSRDIVKLMRIGCGVAGVVYLGIHISTLRLVAVKEEIAGNEAEAHDLINELHELHENLVPLDERGPTRLIYSHYKETGVVHPCDHIVSFFGGFADRSRGVLTMCTEFMDCGSLQRVVDAGGVRDEAVLRHVAYGCLRALAHLKEHRVVHNDIKPANILVSACGAVKIADMGLARPLEDIDEKACGTLAFCAPERMLKPENSSHKSDIWSLGLTLVALASGTMPFTHSTGYFHLQHLVLHQAIEGLGPVEDGVKVRRIDGMETQAWSPYFMTFVTCMLVKKAEARRGAKFLLEHTFMERHKYSPAVVSDPTFMASWSHYIGRHSLKLDGPALLRQARDAIRARLKSTEIDVSLRPATTTPSISKKWSLLRKHVLPKSTADSKHYAATHVNTVLSGVKRLARAFNMTTKEVQNVLLLTQLTTNQGSERSNARAVDLMSKLRQRRGQKVGPKQKTDDDDTDAKNDAVEEDGKQL